MKEYNAFTMFHDQWGLAAAGSVEDYNTCTISWGSMGTLWTRPGSRGQVITVYLHPSRYTFAYFQRNDLFTVSFFPEEYRKALAYLGARSGRDGDKVAEAGLTPISAGDSVTFREAEVTFVCRKLYQHSFSKEDIAPEVQEYYRSNTRSFPRDENGDWNPHWMFVGEVIAVEENRRPADCGAGEHR